MQKPRLKYNRRGFFVLFFHVSLPVYNQHLLAFQKQVPIIVAEMVRATLPGAVEMCEVAKVEARNLEYLASKGGFALGTGLFEKGAVFPEYSIDFLNE